MSFIDKVKVAIFGKRKIVLHVLGDSHIGPLKDLKLDYVDAEVRMCCVQGATASGLQNPHSKTLAGPIFTAYIDSSISKKDWMLLHLGEVDCGFLMWVRSERENMTIDEQAEQTMQNYRQLVMHILSKSRNLILMGIVLPSIKDGTVMGDVANLRGQIKANQIQRTQLTLRMNQRIANLASDQNLFYFDLTNHLISAQTGVLRDEYYNSDVSNHHLESKVFKELVKKHINSIFENNFF